MEYEDLVSGRGLAVLYKFFAQDSDDESVPKELSPAEGKKKLIILFLDGNYIDMISILFHLK